MSNFPNPVILDKEMIISTILKVFHLALFKSFVMIEIPNYIAMTTL